MSLLQKKPPESVKINGEEYNINSDFRVMIAFEQIMENTNEDESSRLIKAMFLFYGANIPKDLISGFKELITFYKCGIDKAERSDENTQSEPAYDFNQDDQYIYAAFLDQYGIDLTKTPYLHWWEFRALFLGLKQDCEISRIMGYRTMKIPAKGMSKQEKAFYRRMKKLFKLRDHKTPEKMTLKQRNNLMMERVRRCALEVKREKNG